MKLMIVINASRMTVSEQIHNEEAMDTRPTRSLPQVHRCSWLPMVTAMLGLPLVGGQKQMESDRKLQRINYGAYDEVLGKERRLCQQDGTRTALTGGKRTGIQ